MLSLLLRTFQRLDRVEQLNREGRLIADWAHVVPGTERAYARMVEVMAATGIDTEGRPPMWAWHGTLRLQDAALLFDPVHELSAGFATVTFSAPAECALLCGYADWCDLLMARDGQDQRDWQPSPLPRAKRHPDQACLPYVLAEWVVGIEPLPLIGWDEIDLDAVVSSPWLGPESSASR